jgi:hypothetical protein
MSSRYDLIDQVESLTVTLTIFEGQGLIGKDRNFLGKRTTSDPYVKIFLGGKLKGQSKVIDKTLNPAWDEEFKLIAVGDHARTTLRHSHPLRLVIYDKDEMTEDDCMGVVDLQLLMQMKDKEGVIEWIPVEKGDKDKTSSSAFLEEHHYCHNAKGKLRLQVSLSYKTRVNTYG